MQRSLEQRMAIKFCVKLEKNAAETIPIHYENHCSRNCVGVFRNEEGVREARAKSANGRSKSEARRNLPTQGTDCRLRGLPCRGQPNVEVLKRLKRRVNRVRPDISKSWKLHHDNAPSHTCFLVADYLVKAGITVVPQPPYSPDVAPPDFFLCPRLKTPMKGHHFGSVKNIQKACADALKAIPENDYRAAFYAWKTRWNRCVDAEGILKVSKDLYT
ncbi:hypothetical protein NQ318_003673 [Aromia moschata]|uniref:Transposase n=1 Tax=Aromia moschata TaxID=1265417 RepID=A0AAV8XK94_9CUCU|nr:hypothetical protein NQ318_003673 [Aromia moschata]